MRHIALTIDVDRDVNQACRGRTAAISKEEGGSCEPRFDSSARGLREIVGILRGEHMRGTFFMEGRTAEALALMMDLPSLMAGQEIAAHGYDHEDFAGKESGLPMDEAATREAMDRCGQALDRIFGGGRRGFRAPYMRSTAHLGDELRRRHYLYDSSGYMEMRQGVVRPYADRDGLMKVPVAIGRDARDARIYGYLWPLHEGKRPVEDYIALLDSFEEGLLVLATHSWHLVECLASGRLDEDACRRGAEDLRRIIAHARTSGMEFVTVRGHLAMREEGV
jgi:peptidoglycan/xylan/chitin deacetylase (PgdA/CDA1 family)